MFRIFSYCLGALAVSLALAPALGAQAVWWDPASGGNGHWYHPVLSNIDYATADAAARAAGGHLAAIMSDAENNFCFDLVDRPQFWFANAFNCSIGPWLGGYQPPGSMEPAGGWTWVTGEAFSYTNWWPGEPNNSGNTEHTMHFYDCSGFPTRSAHWNDITATEHTSGYLIEYELSLSMAVPGMAGRLNQVTVSWASPGATVAVAAGFAPGSTRVPGCPGLSVGIAHAFVAASGNVSGSGQLVLTGPVPGSLAGRTLYFQAVEPSTCRVSNLQSQTF